MEEHINVNCVYCAYSPIEIRTDHSVKIKSIFVSYSPGGVKYPTAGLFPYYFPFLSYSPVWLLH